VKAKLPEGIGTWPAIWMLGQNINEPGAYWQTQGYGNVSWPNCGEIDIMEHWGGNQNYVQSALHTPSSFGGTINHGGQSISNATTSFNIYSLEWTPEKMIFSVNDFVHYIYNPSVKNSETWPFDAPQYLLLNIAIEQNISPNFTESDMEIDYVRIYQTSNLSTNYKTIPTSFTLHQNFPNPFNPTTTINYDLAQDSFVNITIYDMLGNMVNNLVNTNLSSGYKSVKWDGTNDQGKHVSAGVYFYTIQTGVHRQTKKMILLK
jgi:beta-glucanase (GH16 family)